MDWRTVRLGSRNKKKQGDLEVPTHSNAGDVPIVVDEVPLMTNKIQAQHMVVNLIRVLVKTTKSIYLVVSAIRHRGVHETSRPLPEGAGDFWAIAVHCGTILEGGVRHNVRVIRRCGRGRGERGREG